MLIKMLEFQITHFTRIEMTPVIYKTVIIKAYVSTRTDLPSVAKKFGLGLLYPGDRNSRAF
jgi:hypothetical protein